MRQRLRKTKGLLQRLELRDLMALAWFARRAAGHQGASSGTFDPRAEMNDAYLVADTELTRRRKWPWQTSR